MYDTVNFNQFNDWFIKDNSNYKNNFSYEGRKALFDYLEELEDDTGEKIEFDPIALCCEYSEYENFKALKETYDNDEITNLETLRDFTTVIEIENSDKFIISDFW